MSSHFVNASSLLLSSSDDPGLDPAVLELSNSFARRRSGQAFCFLYSNDQPPENCDHTRCLRSIPKQWINRVPSNLAYEWCRLPEILRTFVHGKPLEFYDLLSSLQIPESQRNDFYESLLWQVIKFCVGCMAEKEFRLSPQKHADDYESKLSILIGLMFLAMTPPLFHVYFRISLYRMVDHGFTQASCKLIQLFGKDDNVCLSPLAPLRNASLFMYPLLLPAQLDNVDVVRCLLEHGADPKEEVMLGGYSFPITTTHRAIQFDSFRVLQLLRELNWVTFDAHHLENALYHCSYPCVKWIFDQTDKKVRDNYLESNGTTVQWVLETVLSRGQISKAFWMMNTFHLQILVESMNRYTTRLYDSWIMVFSAWMRGDIHVTYPGTIIIYDSSNGLRRKARVPLKMYLAEESLFDPNIILLVSQFL